MQAAKVHEKVVSAVECTAVLVTAPLWVGELLENVGSTLGKRAEVHLVGVCEALARGCAKVLGQPLWRPLLPILNRTNVMQCSNINGLPLQWEHSSAASSCNTAMCLAKELSFEYETSQPSSGHSANTLMRTTQDTHAP